ncbi:MAG: universal stress protein, partial [Gemmatimonadota bacterium]
MSYQRVLAAVDFSDWTPPVLRVAGDLAGRFGARLTIAHAEAFQPPPYFTEAEVAAIAGSLEHQRRAAAEALTRLAAGAAPAGQRYETQLVEAAPA